MQTKTIEEVNQIYDLEIDKIIKKIKSQGAKKVLLQFPDGLKPYSQVICDEVESKVGKDVRCFIWLGECYGACDVPVQVEKLGVDLIIQFGHSAWNYKRKDINVL